MQTEILRRTLVDQREYLNTILENEKIIKRECKYKIHTCGAYVILGVRRCGKSILSTQLSKNYLYLNFYDPCLQIKPRDYKQLLEIAHEIFGDFDTIIFDEIQELDEWNKVISILRNKYKCILTGSNAKLLSREISTYLTGRHVDYILYPFSFREYLKFKGLKYKMLSTEKIGKLKHHLNEYLYLGGFPEVYKYSKFFLKTIYTDILEKDIIIRHSIKEEDKFIRLSNYVISNSARYITYNKLSKIFEINVHTVENYLKYLQDAFLIKLVPLYSEKLKVQEKNPKKIYSIDCGLINLIISPNKDKLIENLVYLELLRRRDYNFKSYKIFYYKTKNNKEIDFIIKDKTINLIEVTYELDQEHVNKVFKALNELNLKKGLIITWDDEDEIRRNDKIIKVIPLWKWITSPI